MRHVRTGQPIPVAPIGRQATAVGYGPLAYSPADRRCERSPPKSG